MFITNITGRIGSFEFESKKGYSIAKMRIATQKYRGRENGEVTQWHRVIVWGKKAEALQSLHKSVLDTQKQNKDKERGLVGQYGAASCSIEYNETSVTLNGKEAKLPVAEFHADNFDILFTEFKEKSCN